jgi:hypothetical protein
MGSGSYDSASVIVSLHVATGAAAGAVLGSRPAALAAGPLLHALGDRMPHEDIPSFPFEISTGLAGLLLVAATRGPLDPATLGAAAASVPDVEHAVRLPRPGGRKLFPTHRLPDWHPAGGVPASVQLLAAGILLGAVGGSALGLGR